MKKILAGVLIVLVAGLVLMPKDQNVNANSATLELLRRKSNVSPGSVAEMLNVTGELPERITVKDVLSCKAGTLTELEFETLNDEHSQLADYLLEQNHAVRLTTDKDTGLSYIEIETLPSRTQKAIIKYYENLEKVKLPANVDETNLKTETAELTEELETKGYATTTKLRFGVSTLNYSTLSDEELSVIDTYLIETPARWHVTQTEAENYNSEVQNLGNFLELNDVSFSRTTMNNGMDTLLWDYENTKIEALVASFYEDTKIEETCSSIQLWKPTAQEIREANEETEEIVELLTQKGYSVPVEEDSYGFKYPIINLDNAGYELLDKYYFEKYGEWEPTDEEIYFINQGMERLTAWLSEQDVTLRLTVDKYGVYQFEDESLTEETRMLIEKFYKEDFNQTTATSVIQAKTTLSEEKK